MLVQVSNVQVFAVADFWIELRGFVVNLSVLMVRCGMLGQFTLSFHACRVASVMLFLVVYLEFYVP